MTSSSSVSMMNNLKDALRRNTEFGRQGSERFAGVEASADEFVSIRWLLEGENGAELKQPV